MGVQQRIFIEIKRTADKSEKISQENAHSLAR